ncbi:carbon-nitrogen hydrolase family protein [Candidatus Poribacteria bacterium]|nr:carbon-nitrogen hydrolase family protein [Candidatus Poribacteria bacterium]
MGKKIKIAACQMVTELGQIPENLARAERLIEEAFGKGVRWVILPEFFATGMVFHRDMVHAALPLDGPALNLLIDAARRHNGYVGGSFIAIQGENRYNTFVLARPDGTYATHNKDIPTFWENCYYQGGEDDGIIDTDEARVGVALCWEFLRWQTAKRLKGKIDFMVGGSGWWGDPQLPLLSNLLAKQEAKAYKIIRESLGQMARILGVPVVHAAQTGPFKGKTPLIGLPYNSFFLGETQIVDARGDILARLTREDSEGVITAEIELSALPPQEPMSDGFWIPKMPWSLSVSWHLFNRHGKRYYQKMKRKGIY